VSADVVDTVGEEIAWLRTFGWTNDQIARRLGITVIAIEQRDARAKRAQEAAKA
jgi:transcriptional regulator